MCSYVNRIDWFPINAIGLIFSFILIFKSVRSACVMHYLLFVLVEVSLCHVFFILSYSGSYLWPFYGWTCKKNVGIRCTRIRSFEMNEFLWLFNKNEGKRKKDVTWRKKMWHNSSFVQFKTSKSCSGSIKKKRFVYLFRWMNCFVSKLFFLTDFPFSNFFFTFISWIYKYI